MARIGLMLWTVRGECARAFEPTLREVAEMGYEGVELFDLHGHEADEVASWLADTGLVAVGRHASLDAIESELPALAAEARTLGWRRLAVSWVDPSELGPELVRRLTAAAASAAAYGLELGFHNHDAEVKPRDGGASRTAAGAAFPRRWRRESRRGRAASAPGAPCRSSGLPSRGPPH